MAHDIEIKKVSLMNTYTHIMYLKIGIMLQWDFPLVYMSKTHENTYFSSSTSVMLFDDFDCKYENTEMVCTKKL